MQTQLAQAQTENRRLNSELRQQQAEVTRLRSASSSLEERMQSSSSQLQKLTEELRASRGTTQSYQTQLANLQRSLNLKADQNRDLSTQISELDGAMRKLQKDRDSFEAQTRSLTTSLEAERNASHRLSGELDDSKTALQQAKQTITTLTSKEDSLARQYIDLKRQKENLENISRSIDSLRTAVLEEKSERGVKYAKLGVYLGQIPLGTLEWQVPDRLAQGESKPAEVRFATDSIDYVKVTADERHVLRSLGERLKLQVKLASASESFEIKPVKSEERQEVGERDAATWRYSISNRGTRDERLGLSVALVNRNSDEVPLVHLEQLVVSSSVVREVRGYLQPVPLAAGAILGFLLFGIAGIFRKGARRPTAPAPAPTIIGQKQL